MTFTLAALRLMTTRSIIDRFSSSFAAGHSSPSSFSSRRSATRGSNSHVARPVNCVRQTYLRRALRHACRPLSIPAALMGFSLFAVFILSWGALAWATRFVRNRALPISVSTWRTHLPFYLMPSSIYFFRGIGRSNFFTHILHKKRTIAGIQDRLLGFSPGQAVPITASSAATGQSCLEHFSPSRSSDVNETRPHRLDPIRAIGSRPPLPAPYRSWAFRRCSQVRPAWCDFAYDVPAIGGPSAYRETDA